VSSSSAGDIPPTPLTPPRTRGRKLSERREKHVGFIESADEAVEQDNRSASEGEDEGSDDGSASTASRLPEPSPRRLRSRWTARSTSSVGSTSTSSSVQPPRKLPRRQAKVKAQPPNEDDTELDDKDSGGEELPASSELGDDDDAPSGSDADSTPEPRPIRQRKDSKASKNRLQTPPPDDDDMESQHESDEETVGGYQPTPRKLRNGKVLQKDQTPPPPAPAADDDSSELSELSEMDTSVTEESSDSEVDDKNDEDYVEEDSAITMATIATAGVDDENPTIDTDGDVDAEGEDEEIDLREQTATTLARYRKEQLVRLCESKGVDAEGTKPQLVKALLQWVSIRCNFTPSCILSLLVAVTSSICFFRRLNCPRPFNSCTPSSSPPTQTTGTTRRQAGP
jgi:mitogen-activated protein kinase kinase kinase 13